MRTKNFSKIAELLDKKILEKKVSQESNNKMSLELRLSKIQDCLSFAKISHSILGEDKYLCQNYLVLAKIYFNEKCYQQAQKYAELAKRTCKELQIKEQIDLIRIKCLIEQQQINYAYQIWKNIFLPCFNREQYFKIKFLLIKKFNKLQNILIVYKQFLSVIKQIYGENTSQVALVQVQLGQIYAKFNYFSQAISFMEQALQIMIGCQYEDTEKICNIYLIIADSNNKLGNLQKQYTALNCSKCLCRNDPKICEKYKINILHKISINLYQRGQINKSIEELHKILHLQKNYYGECHRQVARTIKNILEYSKQNGIKNQIKELEIDYNRIMSMYGNNQNSRLNVSQFK